MKQFIDKSLSQISIIDNIMWKKLCNTSENADNPYKILKMDHHERLKNRITLLVSTARYKKKITIDYTNPNSNFYSYNLILALTVCVRTVFTNISISVV